MFEPALNQQYREHFQEITSVVERAFAVAAEELARRWTGDPDLWKEMYLLAIDVDGQYHAVTVGVSNLCDITVEVDATSDEPGKVLAR